MSSCESQLAAPRAAFVESDPARAARNFVERPLAARAPEASATPPAQTLEERLTQEFERGRRAGEDELRTGVAREIEAALRGVAHALVAREAEQSRALAALAASALAIAGEIAERIVRRAVTRDLELLAPCIDEALAALPAEAAVTLLLHPEDRAALERGAAPALEPIAARAGLGLASDASLARGEATLSAGAARVELCWSAVVARLRVALESELPLGEPTP